jgi:hypothetical protein
MKTGLWLLAIALELPAAPEYQIRAECDESSQILAEIAKNAPMRVHYSIAGSFTCYAVTAESKPGEPIHGYVLQRGPDAIEQFDDARRQTEVSLFKAMMVAPPPPPKPQEPPPPAAEKPAVKENPATKKKDTEEKLVFRPAQPYRPGQRETN